MSSFYHVCRKPPGFSHVGYKPQHLSKDVLFLVVFYNVFRYAGLVNVIYYRFRAYLNKAQKAALNETLAVCHLVYNGMVHERTALHEQGMKAPTFYTQVPAIARWKKDHTELN